MPRSAVSRSPARLIFFGSRTIFAEQGTSLLVLFCRLDGVVSGNGWVFGLLIPAKKQGRRAVTPELWSMCVELLVNLLPVRTHVVYFPSFLTLIMQQMKNLHNLL